MSESIAELKKLTDEEIIYRHDQQAKHTSVGVSHYLEEIRGRENARLTKSVERMTKYILWLTCIMAVATLVQLLISLKVFENT